MLRVLVVDDMPVFVDFMASVIPWETHGFQLVGTARDGQEALSLAPRLKPHIVLTDITMPHMDGLALTEALKSILPEVAVVLITGHTEFQYARNALRLGAADYLVKPFEAQELLITLLSIKQQLQSKVTSRARYDDIDALHTATLLRQLFLSHSLDLEALLSESTYSELPLSKCLRSLYGFRVATLAFSQAAGERDSLERIVGDSLADGGILFQFTDYDDHLVVLLCYPSLKDTTFYRDDVDALIRAIQDKLEVSVHLGISPLYVCDGQGPFPAIKRALSEALGQLAASPGASAPTPLLKRHRIAIEMKAYLDGHFTEPDLHMGLVARALLVNQTDLRAAFKAEFGLTMTEYVLKLRMEASRELIHQGSHRLSEIALMVGYEDQAYFSRCYKRYFGAAPLKHNRSEVPSET